MVAKQQSLIRKANVLFCAKIIIGKICFASIYSFSEYSKRMLITFSDTLFVLVIPILLGIVWLSLTGN